jgi:AAA domain
MQCEICGNSPCSNPSFCAQARAADEKRHRKSARRAEFEADGGSAPSTSKERPIELIPFEEIKLSTRRRYLIKDLIPRVGLTVVWGPPKCGKSFWTFDAMMYVALGWKYRDRRVHQGPVVYCAFEGQTGMGARVEAFRQRRLATDHDRVPLYFQSVALNLVRDRSRLIAAIKQRALNPVAVVLDTLNRSIQGSESSDEDMTAYVNAADAIRAAFECAVIIVHHCGVQGDRPRGHTSLTGAADAQLAVTRDAANNVTVQVEWMKDGRDGDVITSRLEVVDVGTNEDGDAETSCILREVDTPARKEPKLSPIAKAAFRELHNCLAEMGRPAPPSDHIPVGVQTVTLEEWQRTLDRTGVLSSDRGQRQQFHRTRVTLKNAGLIGIWEGSVWAVR